jgi:Zn-dependent protease with chaperone function/tetratricopeptide (TPR) repeat protein
VFLDFVLFWLPVSAVYVVIGMRQKDEAKGTWRCLLLAAALAASIALAPLGALMLTGPIDLQPQRIPLAIALSFLSFIGMGRWMLPPLNKLSRPALPLVLDEELNSRVALIAVAMRISPPVVRKRQIVNGATMIAAWASGLPQPSLVVTDGLLHRLAPEERDAILAHEMAHIANHSLWPLSAVFPASCVFALLAAGKHDIPLALLLGIFFGMGLRRIVSRFFEADCDRRAARATSYPRMISALYKVHAVHQLRNQGLWQLMAYSVATHPSREVRLSLQIRASRRTAKSLAGTQIDVALSATAPIDETGGTAFVFSPRRFWIHRAASSFAVLVWVAGLVASWRAVAIDPTWPLLSLIFAPTVFMRLAVRPEARRNARRARLPSDRSWIGLAKLGGLAFASAISITAMIDLVEFGRFYVWAGCLAFAAVGIAIFIFRRQPWTRRHFHQALHEQDFEKALRIGGANQRLRNDPKVRLLLSILEIVTGNHEPGIAQLEELVRKHPKYRFPPLVLSEALLDIGQPDRALQTASAAVQQAPKDPLPHAQVARALRLLGRHEEAWAAATKSLELDTDNAFAEAVLASLMLDAGSPQEARRHIERALDLSPGGAYCLVIQAQLFLSSGNLPAAEEGVKAAVAAVQHQPFALLKREIALLEDQLAKLRERRANRTAERFDFPQ